VGFKSLVVKDLNLWLLKMADILKAAFGQDSDEYIRLTREMENTKKYSNKMKYLTKYAENIDRYETVLKSILQKHELIKIEPKLVSTGEPPTAFIAHGGQSSCLRKLCDFLQALGVQPVVAEWNASEGRWTEEHVDKLIENSDCYIVLAEYGGVVDTGTGARYPRLNVIDELSRLRQKHPHRTVLLLEKGTDLPSNLSAIVYERFTRQNLDNALIRVARELKAFGLIQAVKPQ
jgi:predicted nucleotide-binding protein